MRKWTLVTLANLCVLTCHGLAGSIQEITLSNEHWAIRIQPDTLKMVAVPAGGPEAVLSEGQPDLGAVSELIQEQNRAEWKLKSEKIKVTVKLQQNNLSAAIESQEVGVFTWPMLDLSKNIRALIWPRAEGVYVPLDDPRWVRHLVEVGEWNTMEGLSMPFWGVDYGQHCLTWIATNPFNNTICFCQDQGRLRAEFTHEYTRFQKPKTYGFSIRLGGEHSPIEPARIFRQWLTDRGQFVSMQDKAKKIPRVNRLLGAAHAYLWGDAPFTSHDVPRRKWRFFCRKLLVQAQADQASAGKHIRQLMKPEQWKQIETLAAQEWPSKYGMNQAAAAISELLGHTEFYDAQVWNSVQIPAEAESLLRKGVERLSPAELCRLNSLLLHVAYPNTIEPLAEWGDGVSIRMLKQLRQHGFDRMRLCVSGWQGVEKRPEVAAQAEKLGFLFGTYDSYHSIHDPALQGTDNTWPTAQFDQRLYDTGRILRRDGTPLGGFKGIGGKLSPLAARPYLEKRVRQNMRNVPYSYYFVDCDAYGEVHDDYSPYHPAGQADDARARLERLRWIGETFKVPIGSEGGCSYFAGAIHVSEGIFGPLFGWGDPDLRDKESKYYLGGYYPPEGPRIFVQQVPMKERYEYFYYDPRFRLPLYETVFHDSVVTTHHWQNGSLKFENVVGTVSLTELLYMVPPMYHLNLDEFEKHRETMKRHYEFFSPLHREIGFSQMTDFNWLSFDRLLQRTTFDDRVEMIANFSTQMRQYDGLTIPAWGIVARWKQSGNTRTHVVR
jgi:hypothetical protein